MILFVVTYQVLIITRRRHTLKKHSNDPAKDPTTAMRVRKRQLKIICNAKKQGSHSAALTQHRHNKTTRAKRSPHSRFVRRKVSNYTHTRTRSISASKCSLRSSFFEGGHAGVASRSDSRVATPLSSGRGKTFSPCDARI